MSEGGATDSYDVVLDSQPQAGTTVTITVNTADGQTTTTPTSLVFDETNWNVAQSVTVTAVDDAVAEGLHAGSITHTVTSTDANYNGIGIASLTANITDNDAAGVTITESGTTDVSEGGATDSYDVVLDSQPQAGTTVTITINTADGQTTTAPTSLVFDETNWNVAQSVTVTAVDDAVDEGLHTGSITHTATSTDANYNGYRHRQSDRQHHRQRRGRCHDHRKRRHNRRERRRSDRQLRRGARQSTANRHDRDDHDRHG